jgi:hypothetical protein
VADLSGHHVTGRPLPAALTYAGFRDSYGEVFHLLLDACRAFTSASEIGQEGARQFCMNDLLVP